jgi:hypothetical protein
MLGRFLSRQIDRRIEGEHCLGYDCRTACHHESRLVAQGCIDCFEQDRDRGFCALIPGD